ncbi:elongation factor G [Streptantibioticus cattleyicolor]|uniref:Small GTP-binding protein n=1 Tax=Streptantibioticus cattleyicolor (strain ATCC 35852 / DSM 46488 / JCM 4925 / NBRC 14057 / NRRL 8057) TaxID=1003195 RepID=F8JNI0_STREN|nr:TetM/TetW/TetO/TetS family tetracycline resistance ribosomal protection protein [Streptantibioticus cattleyicolor]AEW99051.1 small GTP-binding protein [Streptantibioticus cattleyicolor NRRL 8057 = DSM 46488]CCB71900.1 putative antibiotic resistance protein [Streptantibioticus cattleyicolor NRRL 8057 = DSM 46488]
MTPAPATLNIGILAHIDAGKTSLTERLLFDTGAIDRLGSVDAGDTRTDSGEIERERGITVRSAVTAFRVGERQINLIDTPGHSDFIAEVERVLGVLDAAVLMISAVEGVQAQTRVLMRTLTRLRLPTVLFANKTDRTGARDTALLAEIRRKLTPHVLAVNEVRATGTRGAHCLPRPPASPEHLAETAEVLADHDDGLLADLVDGRVPPPAVVRAALAAQTARGLTHPLVFGSALTGQGVDTLIDTLAGLLPVPEAPRDEVVRGRVFAVERGPAGERIALLRLRSGSLRRGQRLTFHRLSPLGATTRSARVGALEVVAPEPGTLRAPAAGDIVRLWGLTGVRVGDHTGPVGPGDADAHFPPPSLESVAVPRRPEQAPRLHAALTVLADRDPLIGARTVPGRGTAVLLYGEVQKEVIAETLRREFGVEADFEPTRVRYLERPVGRGEAAEVLDRHRRPDFWATVGLRVEPGGSGTGVVFRRETELGALPAAFDRAVVDSVHGTLRQGLHGWPVTDVVVTLTHSGFVGPISTAADFRGLTPLVLMRALAEAGTRGYEPCHAFEAEVPHDCLGPALTRLAALGADVTAATPLSGRWQVTGTLPARQVHVFQGELPTLTGGEGLWWSRPSGDRPVTGAYPYAERTDGNPLDRKEYLGHLARTGGARV